VGLEPAPAPASDDGGKCATCAGAKKKKYKTAREAAVAQMKEYNPKSVAENREYGGWIDKNADGTYSPAETVRGSTDGLTNMPEKGADGVEWWHTHAAYDPAYDSENFSGLTGDKGYSNANSAVGYVATPSGAIKMYNPGTGAVTTLGDRAPP
jgi:Domain of unknown function (DUF4329)